MSPHIESHSYPSYAQAGEDRIIFALFQALGSDHRLRYADIGAAVPAGHNNSYLFYTLGGSGVLAEPDASYVPAYQLLRPRDAIETVAIVPDRLSKTGTITFYAMHNRGWSTVVEEHRAIAERLGKGGVRAQVTVRCMTIGQLLEKHFPDGGLDFLSMDIEGLDTEVMAELDLRRFRPKAIVFEDTNGMADLGVTAAHRTHLDAAGYRPYAFTGVNMIYVDRAALESARF